MSGSQKYTSIGGQAVIEGVMMRSPHFVAIAVRRPDQSIVIRSQRHESITARYPILKKPILRGVVTLVESMVQGIEALSYSANAAVDAKDKSEELSPAAIAFSIASAFILGMALFVGLPHLLTALVSSERGLGITAQNPLFHLIDGGLKMLILLAYVYGIALMKDIRRVFQYHGAEHKSIYAFEAGLDLTVENARKQSTLHPRCGTSFLLFMVLISIVAFSIIFPVFGLTQLSPHPILNHVLMVLVKVALMLPVAGVAYEFIKACAFRMESPVFKMLIWPGLMLQKLTTRIPDDQQLEIALASLKQVLALEKKEDSKKVSTEPTELEIRGLAEIGETRASVQEFPEL